MKSACIVSSFPPRPCGIAAYAEQQASHLASEGYRVTKVSTVTQGEGILYFDFSSFAGLFSWISFWATHSFDRVILHYADGFYFPSPPQRLRRLVFRLADTISLAFMALATGATVIIHEIGVGQRIPFFTRCYRGMGLRFFPNIEFHSEAHRNSVLQSYPLLQPSKTSLRRHAAELVKAYSGSKEDARRELELPQTRGPVFLCIGFWLPSKGFDAAITAFIQAGLPEGSLYIVGSPPKDNSGTYAASLHLMAVGHHSIHFHEATLSDEEFDRWIQASDHIILPYQSVSSSGVAARASLFEKSIVFRDLPQFREEYPEGVFFQTQHELADQFLILSNKSGQPRKD